MKEAEFAQAMQSIIDKRDREIESLKSTIEDARKYTAGLENDYSRIGLDARRVRDALSGLLELVSEDPEANDTTTDLYVAVKVAEIALDPKLGWSPAEAPLTGSTE